jgi:hypothetical protein
MGAAEKLNASKPSGNTRTGASGVLAEIFTPAKGEAMWQKLAIGLATVLLTFVGTISTLVLSKTWSNSEDLSSVKSSIAAIQSDLANQREDVRELKTDVKELLRRVPARD